MTTTELGVSESFALAILDPRSGKRLVDSTRWKAGLAGAAIIDLVRSGTLRLIGPGDPSGPAGRFVATGFGELPGPGWEEVMRRADGQKPKNAVARVGGASSWTDRAGPLWDEVTRVLVADRVVRRDEDRTLGIIPSTRWRVVDEASREAVLDRVRTVLSEGTATNDIDGTVAALLHATEALPKVFPHEPRKWLRAQGTLVARGDWASEAVRRAIADVQSAATAAIVASTSAAVIST